MILSHAKKSFYGFGSATFKRNICSFLQSANHGTACRYRSRASHRETVAWLLVPDELVGVWRTFHREQNGAQTKKHPINSSSVDGNALMMDDFRLQTGSSDRKVLHPRFTTALSRKACHYAQHVQPWGRCLTWSYWPWPACLYALFCLLLPTWEYIWL